MKDYVFETVYAVSILEWKEITRFPTPVETTISNLAFLQNNTKLVELENLAIVIGHTSH